MYGRGCGVIINAGARPLLHGCEIFGNHAGGVHVLGGSHPTLVANIIRDHAGGRGFGILVSGGADADVRPDNRFLRNAAGNVVRTG